VASLSIHLPPPEAIPVTPLALYVGRDSNPHAHGSKPGGFAI
jgi:hypothetical protein